MCETTKSSSKEDQIKASRCVLFSCCCFVHLLLQVYDKEGRFLRSVDVRGEHEFFPHALAFDRDNNIVAFQWFDLEFYSGQQEHNGEQIRSKLAILNQKKGGGLQLANRSNAVCFDVDGRMIVATQDYKLLFYAFAA